MKFRTEINIPRPNFSISYKDTLFFIGSCFSNSIGKRFLTQKFNTLINPFGVLYNPKSILKSLETIKNNALFTEKDLFFHNDTWNSFLHHSSFSSQDKNNVLDHINSSITNASIQLRKTNYAFITLGTAYCYTLKETQHVVSNCHKLPETNFERSLLSFQDIKESLLQTIKVLKYFNEAIVPIFTVSPIRHVRDGFIENSRSKALLLTAIHEIIQEDKTCSYFPSYEILLDDLRDYRFYNEDMIHPSEVAVNYIWSKLSETYFSAKTLKDMSRVHSLVKASNHRPRQPHSSQHQTFIQSHLTKIKRLEDELQIDLSEIEFKFRQQLHP